MEYGFLGRKFGNLLFQVVIVKAKLVYPGVLLTVELYRDWGVSSLLASHEMEDAFIRSDENVNLFVCLENVGKFVGKPKSKIVLV